MRQNIEINIEELRLHGFSRIDSYRIGQALQLELTRLFTEREIPPSLTQDGEFAGLDGGTFNVAPDSRGQVIGAQVAKSTYNILLK